MKNIYEQSSPVASIIIATAVIIGFFQSQNYIAIIILICTLLGLGAFNYISGKRGLETLQIIPQEIINRIKNVPKKGWAYLITFFLVISVFTFSFTYFQKEESNYGDIKKELQEKLNDIYQKQSSLTQVEDLKNYFNEDAIVKEIILGNKSLPEKNIEEFLLDIHVLHKKNEKIVIEEITKFDEEGKIILIHIRFI